MRWARRFLWRLLGVSVVGGGRARGAVSGRSCLGNSKTEDSNVAVDLDLGFAGGSTASLTMRTRESGVTTESHRLSGDILTSLAPSLARSISSSISSSELSSSSSASRRSESGIVILLTLKDAELEEALEGLKRKSLTSAIVETARICPPFWGIGAEIDAEVMYSSFCMIY